MRFENKTPTDAEKDLYQYAGFYVIQNEFYEVNGSITEFEYIKYAVCYTDDVIRNCSSFPTIIDIDEKQIDYSSTITFCSLSQEVTITGAIDTRILSDVVARTKELGWKEIRAKEGKK